MKKNKNNAFLKFRKWLEHDISIKVKNKTGSDLFDWISLIFLFSGGSILTIILFLNDIIKLSEALSGFILWFTAFAILRYTKETYYLKKLSQKQNITSVRPYLRLQWEATKNLVLVNEGKGVAVNLRPIFKKGNNQRRLIQISAMAASPGSQTRSFIPNNFQPPLDPNLNFNKYLIEIAYTDIEKRQYIAIFETDTNFNDEFKIIRQEEIK